MEEIVSRDIILSQVDENCSNLCSEIEAQIPLTFNRHDVKEYWSQPHKSPSGNITSADIWNGAVCRGSDVDNAGGVRTGA